MYNTYFMQIYKKNPKLKNINLGINTFYIIHCVALPMVKPQEPNPINLIEPLANRILMYLSYTMMVSHFLLPLRLSSHSDSYEIL